MSLRLYANRLLPLRVCGGKPRSLRLDSTSLRSCKLSAQPVGFGVGGRFSTRFELICKLFGVEVVREGLLAERALLFEDVNTYVLTF